MNAYGAALRDFSDSQEFPEIGEIVMNNLYFLWDFQIFTSSGCVGHRSFDKTSAESHGFTKFL